MVGVLEVRVQKVRLSWKVDFGSKSDFDRLVIYDAQQNLNSQRNFPAVRQLDPLDKRPFATLENLPALKINSYNHRYIKPILL